MYKDTLINQFLSICDLHADTTALQTYTEELSYSELKHRVSKVSDYLTATGIKPGERVALVIDNSINYVIAFYAIWKSGAIVVALNAQSKFHEIEKLINQCQSKCILVEKLDDKNKKSLKSSGIKTIVLDDKSITDINIWKDEFCNQANSDSYEANESTLAQIIYTSGTTGNPKGVLLSHGNLMCNTRDIVKYLNLSSADSIVNALPFYYSYGNSVLHTHLCVGAKIILTGSLAFPQQIVNDMRKYEPSGFSGVPSTYSLLLTRSDWKDNPPPFRYITQAGGPMGKKLTEQLIKALNPDTQLYIMYGQTEASARISWLPPQSLKSKAGSAGIAIDHVKIEIRDEHGDKLPAYAKGEVYVYGKSIMQGYWNNPHATQQVLNNGWLKTGDLGYLDADGYIFLEGRNSDMIKVGAHRIHPQELEEVINKLNFISECAVIGIDDEILGQKLKAFIVGDESKANLLEFKKHCNEYLPAHKIPREIKWINELPKTASGKIKRYKLKS